MQEISLLKQRLDQLEEELKKLREETRIGTIEYHIENLRVESIQNGILDLGVHMGNELDKRIQTSGMAQPTEGEKSAGETSPELTQRVQDVEQNVAEVKEQIQSWQERLQAVEQQMQSFEQRIRNLEAIHW